MAHTVYTFENERTGQSRQVPVGVSWTVLFFGFFVPLWRSDWKWAVIMLLIGVFTYGLSNLIFCGFYNDLYRKELQNNGYKPEGGNL